MKDHVIPQIEEYPPSLVVLGHRHANHWNIETIHLGSSARGEIVAIRGEMHVAFLDARTRLCASKSNAVTFASKLLAICDTLEIGNEVRLNSIAGCVESTDGFELRISLDIRGQGVISGFISEQEQKITFQFASDLMAVEQFAKSILKVASQSRPKEL
jgi:hypothetical protein